MDIIFEKEIDKDDKELIEKYHSKNMLHQDFQPFFTYDLVQTGYPYPTEGKMIVRPYGGSDSNGKLLFGGGEWVRLETVLKLIEQLQKK